MFEFLRECITIMSSSFAYDVLPMKMRIILNVRNFCTLCKKKKKSAKSETIQKDPFGLCMIGKLCRLCMNGAAHKLLWVEDVWGGGGWR